MTADVSLALSPVVVNDPDVVCRVCGGSMVLRVFAVGADGSSLIAEECADCWLRLRQDPPF